MRGLLKELWEILIPQFVTDRVALGCNDDEWYVICLEENVTEDDIPNIEAYGTIRTFTWLGWAKGGRCILDD